MCVRKRKMSTQIILITLFIVNINIESFVSLHIPHYVSYNPEGAIKKREADPLALNLTQCAHKTRSSIREVENYIKRMPQQTVQGKCFVACMLKKSNIIRNNKVSPREVVAYYSMTHAERSPFMVHLKGSLHECTRGSEGIPDVCEQASVFSECLNSKLGSALEALAIKALENWDSTEVNKEEEDIINYVRDRL